MFTLLNKDIEIKHIQDKNDDLIIGNPKGEFITPYDVEKINTIIVQKEPEYFLKMSEDLSILVKESKLPSYHKCANILG